MECPLSTGFRKFTPLPPLSSWRETRESEVAVSGMVSLYTRHLGRFLDTVSREHQHMCIFTHDGVLYIYAKDDTGYAIRPADCNDAAAIFDYVRIPPSGRHGEFKRCRIKLRFTFGTLNMTLVNADIYEWRTALIDTLDPPPVVVASKHKEATASVDTKSWEESTHRSIDASSRDCLSHSEVSRTTKSVVERTTATRIEEEEDEDEEGDAETTVATEESTTTIETEASEPASAITYEIVEPTRPPHRTSTVGVLRGATSSSLPLEVGWKDPLRVPSPALQHASRRSSMDRRDRERLSIVVQPKQQQCRSTPPVDPRPSVNGPRTRKSSSKEREPTPPKGILRRPSFELGVLPEKEKTPPPPRPLPPPPRDSSPRVRINSSHDDDVSEDDGLFSHIETDSSEVSSVRESSISVGTRRRQLEERIRASLGGPPPPASTAVPVFPRPAEGRGSNNTFPRRSIPPGVVNAAGTLPRRPIGDTCTAWATNFESSV